MRINIDELEIEDEIEKERKDKGTRGKLHGITIILKDNIATEDSMEKKEGSMALLGYSVKREAFVEKQLRNAGAVMLGKKNMREWENIR